MVNSTPNSPADLSAVSSQRFMRTQCNFPFPKASQQDAECSSSFTEPLTLGQGHSPKERQLPSRSAVGWGEEFTLPVAYKSQHELT